MGTNFRVLAIKKDGMALQFCEDVKESCGFAVLPTGNDDETYRAFRFNFIRIVITCRKRDIGIRMALGATRRKVASMILWQASSLMLLGIFLGLIGTFFSTILLRNMLFGIAPADPRPLLIACLVISTAGGIAAYLPARHAAAIDPMQALRTE
jgi:ABC-type antimicrobial peptide transport system permease subunit